MVMTLDDARAEIERVQLPEMWQVEVGDIMRPDGTPCLGINFYTHDGQTQRGLLRMIPWVDTEPGCVADTLTLMSLDITLPPMSEMSS